MQTIGLKHDGKEAPEGEPLKLEVLLLHENLPAGLRGKQLIDRVGNNLGLKSEFRVNLWNSELLRDSGLLERAVEEARHADIIVLAVDESGPLSGMVRSWLELWLGSNPDNPSALVLSFNARVRDWSHANTILNYVQDLAKKAGVEFFPHFGATPQTAWDWRVQGKTEDPVPTFKGIFAPQRHFAWGLNE